MKITVELTNRQMIEIADYCGILVKRDSDQLMQSCKDNLVEFLDVGSDYVCGEDLPPFELELILKEDLDNGKVNS